MSETIYRTCYTNGRSSTEHATMAAAQQAVREAMGWEEIVVSDKFALGSCEGARGNVYGVECYATDDDLDAAERGGGSAYAPQIKIIRGDEAWAMGRDA